MTIDVTDRDGRVHRIARATSGSLMELLRDQGLPIAAICGGARSCATCHVYLDSAEGLSPADLDERDLLEETGHFIEGRSRLSCQVRAEMLPSAVAVTLAPETL